jgi:very-short-patch-repair endonuclease
MRDKQKTSAARHLRASMTDAEQHLWKKLRGRQISGLHFRRQCPIGPYVCDFVCKKRKLVIELDGSQHVQQKNYDKARDLFLHQQGFLVLRFWNNEVLSQTQAVLDRIYEHLNSELIAAEETLHKISPPP